jgi:hypothetical protein
MTLTNDDLKAIKKLIDESITERVPGIVTEIINERVPALIDDRVPAIIDERVPALVQPIIDKAVDDLRLDSGMAFNKVFDRLDEAQQEREASRQKIDDIAEVQTKMQDTISLIKHTQDAEIDRTDRHGQAITKMRKQLHSA